MTNFDEAQLLETIGNALRAAAAQGKDPLARMKHDLASTTLTTNLMHGPNGIFGERGIERDVFATRVKSRGLLQILSAYGTLIEQPLVAYLTGFTDDESGTEKSGPCDDPLAAGEIKSCLQGAMFGRYERKTDPIELNAIGRTVNRGEFRDLRLVNDPLLESGLSVSNLIPRAAGDVLNREILARWMAMGVAFERLLGPQVYTGSPVNNTAGGYAEFHGLETLVGTGKIDVITGTACAALDSDIRNFNYLRVDANGTLILQYLIDMFRNLQDIASRTGLDPVNWVIVMRRNLFNEIADVWPCAYNTYRCTVNNVQDQNIDRIFVDGERQRAMSDAIRNGLYLTIDGRNVPVVIDDFIPEDSNTTNANVTSGCFASDIYILPLNVRGGIESTFMEYIDYQGAGGAMQAVQDGRLMNEYWTDGGRFLWTFHRTGWCVEWWSKIEPRLRLLTPHLAGRIQNVGYCPIKHFREDDPTSSYFQDGGDYARSTGIYTNADFPARVQ